MQIPSSATNLSSETIILQSLERRTPIYIIGYNEHLKLLTVDSYLHYKLQWAPQIVNKSLTPIYTTGYNGHLKLLTADSCLHYRLQRAP